jgi:hypothetical protein
VTNNRYNAEVVSQVTAAVASFGLAPDVVARLAAAAKVGTAAAYNAVPGITPAVRAAAVLANKNAYLDGAHLSYQVALAFGLVGCVAALFIPTVDKRKYTAKTVALQHQDRLIVDEKKGHAGA